MPPRIKKAPDKGKRTQKPVAHYMLRSTQAESANSDHVEDSVQSSVTPIQIATRSQAVECGPAGTMADLQSIKQMISEMEQRLTTKMSDLLKENEKNLEESVAKIAVTVSEHSTALDMQAQDLHQVKTVLIPEVKNELFAKIQQLENDLILLEIHHRKKNLLIHGIPLKTVSIYEEDTTAVIQDFLQNKLKIPKSRTDQMQFIAIHRIPRRTQLSLPVQPQPPPIIVAFVTHKDRDVVLSSAPNLKGTSFSVRTDLPRKLNVKRAELAKQAYQLRQNGKKTRIRVIGTEVILETQTDGKWSRHTGT